MKTVVTIAASAVLGFTAVFLCVPAPQPEQLPPTWFELPGVPVRVGGTRTPTWCDVHRELLRATWDHQQAEEFRGRHENADDELRSPGIQVEYIPWNRSPGLAGGSHGATVVTVRSVFPQTVPWSRAREVDLVRFEVDRPHGVD